MGKEQSPPQERPEVDLSDLEWRTLAFERTEDTPLRKKVLNYPLWEEFYTLHDMSFSALRWKLSQDWKGKEWT